MDAMTLGPPRCWASHAAPSDPQAAELLLTLVSQLQGLTLEALMELWRHSSFKCHGNW